MKINPNKIKIRKFWTRNPTEQIEKSDKIYNRKKYKNTNHGLNFTQE